MPVALAVEDMATASAALPAATADGDTLDAVGSNG